MKTYLDNSFRILFRYSIVFPILQTNLLSAAGIWAGFDEDWWVETIMIRPKKFPLDKEIIFNSCYRLIENNFQSFKGENQIRNCSYWLEEKRQAYL